MKMARTLVLATVAAFASHTARAQFDSGSDGSDGAFTGGTVDLSLAATGNWFDPSPFPGRGVYDPNIWAVVFKYSSVNLSSNTTFFGHPSGAPVVWLVEGNVNIVADIAGSMSGENSFNTSGDKLQFSRPGPGGFPGGIPTGSGLDASGGFGPGGSRPGASGSHATSGVGGVNAGPTYGGPGILRLMGGSGGGPSPTASRTGAGGGGAILIASSGRITMGSSGRILARGGNGDLANVAGAGAGGAVRLIANELNLLGTIDARGGTLGSNVAGGDGYIRLETTNLISAGNNFPLASISTPGDVFPEIPQIRVVAIGGRPVPLDPIQYPSTTDVVLTNDGEPVTVNIEAEGVPPGTTVSVLVKPGSGQPFTVTSTPLVGKIAFSTATAEVTVPQGPVEFQLRANW